MARAAEAQLDARGGPSPRGAAGRRRRSPSSRSTVPCSSTPARTRCSTYSRGRGLEHDRLDARALEQVREQQPGGPGADDPDLGLHHAPPARSSRARGGQRRRPAPASVIAISTTSGTVQSPASVVHGAEQPRPGRRDEVADAERHRGQRRDGRRVAAALASAASARARARRPGRRRSATIHSGATPGAASTPGSPAAGHEHDREQQPASGSRRARGEHRHQRTRARAARARRTPAARRPPRSTSRRPRGSRGSTTARRRTPSTARRRSTLTAHARPEPRSGAPPPRATVVPGRSAAGSQTAAATSAGSAQTASDASQPPSALRAAPRAPAASAAPSTSAIENAPVSSARRAGWRVRMQHRQQRLGERDRHARRERRRRTATPSSRAAQRRCPPRSAARTPPAARSIGTRAARRGATGANAPMHSTGSVVSSPPRRPTARGRRGCRRPAAAGPPAPCAG